MKNSIKTSLLSIVCVMATGVMSSAMAASSVRSVGGTASYNSAASASAAKTLQNRAGALRATAGTAGVVRKNTTGTNAVNTQRLSIGKYLGAPKSVSSNTSIYNNGTADVTNPTIANEIKQELEKLRSEVERIQQDKSGALEPGDDLIIIKDNEILLNIEELTKELAGNDGTNGREIEINTDKDNNIVWRYVGDSDWKTLLSIDDIRGLSGKDGTDGADGREIELSSPDGSIWWRYKDGGDWKKLVDVSALKGENGQDGADGNDGRQVQIGYNGTVVSWKYVDESDTAWRPLFDTDDIRGLAGTKGDAGVDGKDGKDGADGRNVELNVTDTHVVWRYEDESQWHNLVSLETLRGADGRDGTDGKNGADGKDGVDGADGREIELDRNDTSVVWRYSGESAWRPLIALESLRGADGRDGTDGKNGADGKDGVDGAAGREIELSTNATNIIWRYAGDTTWNNLIALESLRGADGAAADKGEKGDTGDKGADGREIELSTSATNIIWRYVGDSDWRNLTALESLRGADGRDGVDGTDGKNGIDGLNGADGRDGVNGREIELNNDGTAISWRYAGDTTWNTLIALESLRGADGQDGAAAEKGEKGDKGDDGIDGREIELNKTDTNIVWRYSGDDTWNTLVSLESLRGVDGKDGTDGVNGKDGVDGINGKELELKTNDTSVIWRYVGDGDDAWKTLIDLESLRGADGDKGDTGDKGADGRSVELDNNGAIVRWRFVGDESDDAWKTLIDLETLRGADGRDGVDGKDADADEIAQYVLSQIDLSKYVLKTEYEILKNQVDENTKNIEKKLNKNLGKENAGDMLVINNDGDITNVDIAETIAQVIDGEKDSVQLPNGKLRTDSDAYPSSGKWVVGYDAATRDTMWMYVVDSAVAEAQDW